MAHRTQCATKYHRYRDAVLGEPSLFTSGYHHRLAIGNILRFSPLSTPRGSSRNTTRSFPSNEPTDFFRRYALGHQVMLFWAPQDEGVALHTTVLVSVVRSSYSADDGANARGVWAMNDDAASDSYEHELWQSLQNCPLSPLNKSKCRIHAASLHPPRGIARTGVGAKLLGKPSPPSSRERGEVAKPIGNLSQDRGGPFSSVHSSSLLSAALSDLYDLDSGEVPPTRVDSPRVRQGRWE